MNRSLSNLGPVLCMAIATLAATALATAAPAAPWTAVAAVSLLVLAMVGTDLVDRRRAGRRSPSWGALLLAAAILVACALVAASGLDHLAAMLPILGSCAAMPAILRLEGGGRRRTCP
jgi:peptidoglycan/LPS O-acetylase OafA/YrhL